MKNKKRISIILLSVIGLAGLAVFAYLSGVFVPDELNTDNFKIETIERGKVLSEVTATGVVESENEVLILSPASSLILKIEKEPGSWVEKGEVILQLDKEQLNSEIENISDQLEMKKNSKLHKILLKFLSFQWHRT